MHHPLVWRVPALIVAVLIVLSPVWSSVTASQTVADRVSGEFVGTVAGQPHLFVAVVASPAAPGAGERQVRGYLCDGEQVAEWFVGSVTGNSGELTNEGGVRFVAELAEGAATGRITLPGGVILNYDAPRAAGIAGLYDVEVTPEGQIRGLSAGGVRYEGQFTRGVEGGGPSATRRFILPNGATRELTTPLSGQPLGQYHVIVQDDMSLRGFASLVRSTTADQAAGRARLDGQAYFACFTLTTVGRGPGVEPFRCIH